MENNSYFTALLHDVYAALLSGITTIENGKIKWFDHKNKDIWVSIIDIDKEEYCVEYANGDKEWWQNGLRHRIDGPALYNPIEDCQIWFKNGKLHNPNGFAIKVFGNKYWYQDGKQHRLDGPAVEGADGQEEYFIDGEYLTKKEFKKRTMKANKLDTLGVILSIGCMLHCLLLPIILPTLPLLGFAIGHDGYFHLVLSVLIVGVASLALLPGYYKHKSFMPIKLGTIGIVILISAGILETIIESNIMITLITVIGSIFVTSAHIINHKILCKCSHHDHNIEA